MTLPEVLAISRVPAPADAATSEERLVVAAQAGDPQAFGALVRRHQRHVYQLVGRFFRRHDEVDDVAQEVFVQVWRKLSSYRGDAPFEHWLTRVCCNLCYQELRRRRPATVDLDDIEPPAAPERDPTAALEASRLLARLDPRDRFLLLLLEGEGWSTAEIAERLGWSRTNVKVRAHRARKKLLRIAAESGA